MADLLITSPRLFYQTKSGNKEITKDIAAFLESFSYTDKTKDEVDEISLTLQDISGTWRGPWIPRKGDIITALIVQARGGKVVGTLFCGKFTIDSMSASGPPSKFEIKAVGVPFGSEFRRTRKSMAWEGVYLKDIAATVTARSKISLTWESSVNPYYRREDQKRESDAAFLQRLCQEAGLAMKVTADRCFIFDQEDRDKRPAIRTIWLTTEDLQRPTLTPDNTGGPGSLISWDMSTKLTEETKEAKVSYNDPKTGEVFLGRAEDMMADPKGQVIHLVKRATSMSEAQRLAESELKKRNKLKIDGNLTLVGDVSLCAGQNVDLRGFGWFDGKYSIEESSHQLNPYRTSIKIRNIEAPAEEKKKNSKKSSSSQKKKEDDKKTEQDKNKKK